MSTIKTNNLQTLDGTRNITLSKVAEMNGGFSFRNKIIDGRFDFWYEGTSSTVSGYGAATMWVSSNGISTKTASLGTLTTGVDLPCIDNPSAQYYHRTVVASVAGSGAHVTLQQQLESVKTLAGKTATISFYARSDAARNIAVELLQHIDSTATTDISIPAGLIALTTSWAKYKVTVSIPSLYGKTITSSPDFLRLLFWFDAGTSLAARASNLGQQSGTFDIACVQLEEGTVATPFEELPPDIAKLRLSRYFLPLTTVSTTYSYLGLCTSATQANIIVQLPTPMRTISPSVSGVTGVRASNSGTYTQTAVSVSADHENYAMISITSSGMPVWGVCRLTASGLSFLDARI